VINQSDLVFRTSDNLTADGLYFSTFFGGSDSSWSPSKDTHTYFRNIELFGGPNPSNLTGAKITSGAATSRHFSGGIWIYLVFALVGALVI
jgi:hypothetical protein